MHLTMNIEHNVLLQFAGCSDTYRVKQMRPMARMIKPMITATPTMIATDNPENV